MFRALVRRVIGPLVRWASVGGDYQLGQSRNDDGMVCLLFRDEFERWYVLDFSPDEMRDVCRNLMRLARDAQEGVPLVDDPTLPPL